VFDPKQIAQLEAPLSREYVKEREQGGKKLSYIEAWHAIAEANRIFGFDGWTRETIDIRPVSERERQIGRPPNTRQGWGVSYIAKVRVIVNGIVREGTGAGHGIDVDLGLAHESAAKEAESDAMKRALMTFGNPFGLALYDKQQANVADEVPEYVNAQQVKAIRDLITEVGADEPKYLEYLKVESVEKIPASKYGYAVSALMAKKKKEVA